MKTAPPKPLPDELQQLLQQLAERLQGLYGERYRGLVLFGSYARGEATEHSDVDLLLLLQDMVNAGREIRRFSDIIYPLELDSDHLLALTPVSLKTYRHSGDPFLVNARREGVVVSVR